MDYDEDIVSELDQEECWAALRADEFARLAYHLGDELDLVPLNYAVDGDTLLFRTAEGSKLLGIVMNPDVVLEIDTYDEDSAQSVVVHGTGAVAGGGRGTPCRDDLVAAVAGDAEVQRGRDRARQDHRAPLRAVTAVAAHEARRLTRISAGGVGVEPPVGIEPTTYSLRVNRSTD